MDADRALNRLGAKFGLSPAERTGAMGLFLQQLTASQDFLDTARSHYENALIGMASRTQDPQVYALAFLSCGYHGANGVSEACGLLSAEQWTRIEPDNGVPWLLVASAAQAAHNEAARDNAIRRAAGAKSFDAHRPNFLGLMRAPELRNETPETRSDLAWDLFSMQMLLPTQPYGLFLRFCNYPSVANPSRIDACNDLTRLLLEHDRTMAGFSAGVRLAQSANWPPDRVESLRQEKKSYMAALAKKGVLQEPPSAAADCGNFESRTTNYEFLGELGIARRLAE
jgi:hypothetical protein